MEGLKFCAFFVIIRFIRTKFILQFLTSYWFLEKTKLLRHLITKNCFFREFCDLGKVKAWRDYTDLIPGDLVHRLVHIYKSPEDVDLYVAGNMESPVEGSLLGPTFHCLVREQFERLRDADRFFYTNPGHFTRAQLATIAEQTLSRVLCDNADDPASMRLPKNIFRLANDVTNPLRHCTDKVSHPTLNVNAWR